MTLNLKLPKSQAPGSEVVSPTFKMHVGLVAGPAYRGEACSLWLAQQPKEFNLGYPQPIGTTGYTSGMAGGGTLFRRKGCRSKLGQRDRPPVLNPQCGPAPSTVLERADLISPHRTQRFFSNQCSHRQVNR